MSNLVECVKEATREVARSLLGLLPKCKLIFSSSLLAAKQSQQEQSANLIISTSQ